MNILQTFEWIESTSWSTAIRESAFLFPAIESAHVIALTFVVGSIWIIDLRLLGVASSSRSIKRLSAEILPWTWGAFGVAALTGLLLFISTATRYYENIPFRIKVVLLALAGLNMMLFHTTTYRTVAQWDAAAATPQAAKVSAAISMVVWIAVVAFGRWIGFT